MHLLALTPTPTQYRLLMLGGAVAILYVLGRLVMGVIPRGLDGSSSLRALLAAGVVLLVGATAVIMGHSDVGLHLPIAAASGALSYGIAATILGRGPRVHGSGAAIGSRSWAFVMPAVAILLIGALGGRADWLVLAALLGFGTAAMLAWLPDRIAARAQPVAAATPIGGAVFGETVVVAHSESVHAHAPVRAPLYSHGLAATVWSVGAILAVLAGMMAVLGMPALEAMHHVPPDAVVTVFLLAPAIVVPLVFELLPPCRPIGWTASISTLTKFAVLCLCIALPAIVLVNVGTDLAHAIGHAGEPLAAAAATRPAGAATAATSMPATTMSTAAAASSQPTVASGAWPTIEFPSLPGIALSTDVLTLAAASLLLLPLASGWLKPGKLEAAALFACYLVNLYLLIHTMYA